MGERDRAFGRVHLFLWVIVLTVPILPPDPTVALGGEESCACDRELAKKDLVAAIGNLCTSVKLGQVCSQKAIERMKDKIQREAATRELGKARILLKDLYSVCEHLIEADITAGKQLQIVQDLLELRDRIEGIQPAGIGNVELGSALSMMAAGIFFQGFNELSEKEKALVFRVLRKHNEVHNRAFTRDVFAGALDAEGLELPKVTDRVPCYVFMIMVAFGTEPEVAPQPQDSRALCNDEKKEGIRNRGDYYMLCSGFEATVQATARRRASDSGS